MIGTNGVYILQVLTPFSTSYQKLGLLSSKSIPSRKLVKVPLSYNHVVCFFSIFVTSEYVFLLCETAKPSGGVFIHFTHHPSHFIGA